MAEKKKEENHLDGLDVETLLIHADEGIEKIPDMAPPIHVATTFKYVNTENSEGYAYTRFDQPTRKRLEAVLSALEGGHALVYSSGQTAGFAALMYFRPQRIFINKGYFGSHSAIQAYFSPIDKQWFNRVHILKDSITPQAGDLLWLETPKNPTCEMEDISHYVKLAHAVGATVLVDSTFATPILQKPLDFGADIVMHSCTKFLSGHSDILCGVLISKKKEVYSGLKSQRTTLGGVPGNLETFLLLRSLRELDVRLKRQVKNAIAVAAFLSGHSKVTKVWHPSLESHPDHQLGLRQMKKPPGIMSFEVDPDSVKTLLENLKLISCCTSLGGVHTTIDWRHRFDPQQDPSLLRLSIGIESKKDIIADLNQALNKLE